MLFKKKNSPERSLFKIFSFYNEKINPAIPQYQRMVFEKFGLSINHVVDNKISHGDFLNKICRTVTDTDYLIFFDVDCIPTKRDWLSKLLIDLLEPRSIVGAAKTANHVQEGKNLYVAPFFFAISTAYLKALGYPDMRPTERADAGQNLTEHVVQDGGNISYWWPTHIEEAKWKLHHPVHTEFGFGTTYDNTIYHAFESRESELDRFIVKCKEILGEDAKRDDKVYDA